MSTVQGFQVYLTGRTGVKEPGQDQIVTYKVQDVYGSQDPFSSVNRYNRGVVYISFRSTSEHFTTLLVF